MVYATGVNEGDVVPVITAAGLTKTMAPREDTIRTEDLPWADSDIRDFYRNVMAVIEGKAESRIKLDEVAKSYAPDGSNFRICRKETGYQIRSLKTGEQSECLQNGRSDSIDRRRGIHEQNITDCSTGLFGKGRGGA